MTNNQTAIVRTGHGSTEIQSHAETASTALAAQAKAAIEARWIIAKSQPRNMETVRQELLKECLRPSFAESAVYLKPIGEGITGLSIRFVEAAQQAMGNIDAESVTIYDDDEKRIVRVSVTDFERNVSYGKQVTITKTVERKFLRRGQVPISQRTNSVGETTYVVPASEDDLLNKEGALVSKAMRTNGLRIIPGWLQDECMQIIRKTAADEAARDPDAEMRKLLDGFGQLGITPGDLEEYLAHPLSQIVPAELVQLRAVWKTIQDGEATWVDTLAHRTEMRGEDKRTEAKEKPQKPAAPAKASKGTQAVRDAMARKGKPPGVPEAALPPAIKVTDVTASPAATVEAVGFDPSATIVSPGKPAPEISTAADKPVDAVPLPGSIDTHTPVTAEIEAEAADMMAEAEAAEKTNAQAMADQIKGPPPETEKRPSRSKAAQEIRKAEVAGLPIVHEKKAGNYIRYGDPRNFDAGFGDPPTQDPPKINVPATEVGMRPAEPGQVDYGPPNGNGPEPATVAATETVPAHNPETGEAVEGDEPKWLTDDAPPPPPPKGEAF